MMNSGLLRWGGSFLFAVFGEMINDLPDLHYTW
jgi:hypothetical protein